MKKSKIILLLFVFLFASFSSLKAQEEWLVPESQKGKLAKNAFDEQAVQNGEELYMINCKSCHGTPGKGDYLTTLSPLPGDPADEKYQSNLDGELYYKIRTGKGQMPSFKMVLTPNQAWDIIAYLRSFNDAYVQEIAKVVEGMELKWEDIEIILSIIEGHQLEAKVVGMEEDGLSPVPGADVQLFAKRTFGNLLLEEGTTNDLGITVFEQPADLPGNPEGAVGIMARLADEETFGTVVTDTLMTVGLPLTPVSLTKERAMWNTVRKAPYWILITYVLGVLAVWGLIFFVMVELRSIFKIGQYFEKED